MSDIFGSTAAGILIIILLIAVIALIVVSVNLSLKISRLTRRYKLFMKGSDGQTMEKSLTAKFKDIERIQNKQGDNTNAIRKLANQMDRSPSRYGIVKYDAFEDVGGKMSFALAMLDVDNSGFVLNAIHSRDNCYLYLKEIVKGESYIMLSDEEIDALKRAYHMGDEQIDGSEEMAADDSTNNKSDAEK